MCVFVCACLIPGILLIGRGQDDIAEARALSHGNDIIDIYSNSWGPLDEGFIVQGPGRLAKRTFKEGVQEVSNQSFVITRAEVHRCPVPDCLSLLHLLTLTRVHPCRDEMEKARYMCGLLAMEEKTMTRVLQMVM